MYRYMHIKSYIYICIIIFRITLFSLKLYCVDIRSPTSNLGQFLSVCSFTEVWTPRRKSFCDIKLQSCHEALLKISQIL